MLQLGNDFAKGFEVLHFAYARTESPPVEVDPEFVRFDFEVFFVSVVFLVEGAVLFLMISCVVFEDFVGWLDVEVRDSGDDMSMRYEV